MKTLFTAIALLCYTFLFSQAGGLDSSFGTGGKFIYGGNEYPIHIYASNDAAIQKDGKTLLAGYGYDYNSGYYAQQMAVIRLNKNGTLDNTFGDGGKTFISLYGPNGEQGNNQAFSVSIQPDGKILVAGTSFTGFYIDSLNTYNYDDILVARLNTNGTLDNTFNGTGTKTIDLSSYTHDASGSYSYSTDYCFSADIKSNGKIVLGCFTTINDFSNGSYSAPCAIQLNADGSFDNSFATSGIALFKTPNINSTITRIAASGNNKIVMTGTSYPSYSNTDRNVLAIRLKANGFMDSTFGGTGRVTVDIAGVNDYGNSLAVLSNNKILIGADTYNAAQDSIRVALVKLNANGTLDNTFNGTGKVTANKNFNNYETDIALQKDGKILLSGAQYADYSDSAFNYIGNTNHMLLRFSANGSIDSSFGTYGKTVIDFGKYTDNVMDFSTAVKLQADGMAVISGIDFTDNTPCAARIRTTGKNYGITAPANKSVAAATGQCSVVVNGIDPIVYPDTSFSIVKYSLYNTGSMVAYDSGYGSVSGKAFKIGSTTVVYTSSVDGLQRGVFRVNVSGGTPAGALDFDGVDDRVYINSYLDPINSISYGQYAFEAWIKVRGYGADGSLIFGNERNNNSGIIVELNSKGYITTYHPSVGYVVSKSKVALNKWTHIAFTQTNTSLDLYVNGKFVQTLLTAPYLHTSTYTNFYLGAYTDDDVNFSRYYNGEMDEVRVWGQAICKAQIQNNLRCEAVDGSSQGLLAHFSFNQGNAACYNQTATTAYGYFATGLLQNFALTGPTSNWVTGYISGSCAPFVPLAITSYPPSVNVQATGDSCGATVNFAVTYSSGCSANPTLTYSQNPGTYFPVGTTYVSATLQDSFGNTQYVSFPVTVTETVPPILVLKDTSVMLNQYGYVYVNPYDLIDSLYDNCTPGYSLYPYVTGGNTYLNCSNKGPNPVTITVYDQSGNSTTKTAYVTVAPYVATATVTAIPNPQQYSDYTTVIATLPGAQNLYYYGCLYGSQVTFKVGGKDYGTVALLPDGYGNLTGSFSYQLTDIFPKKVTAVFSGVDSTVYKLTSNTISTTLNGTAENARVDYIESQLINASSGRVTIPVAVQLTDTADGSRGDIRKSVVTFLIQPVTGGATVVGSNTSTVSTLEFVSSDKTSGVARSSFAVNLGRNNGAKFNVTATVSNYYTGSTTATVYVSQSSGSLIADSKTSLNDGARSLQDDAFGVTVLPNPSQTGFSLQVNSSMALEKVTIRISDAAGRVIETFTNVSAGSVVHVGANYQRGVYMAEISQGTNRKSYKLVKL